MKESEVIEDLLRNLSLKSESAQSVNVTRYIKLTQLMFEVTNKRNEMK